MDKKTLDVYDKSAQSYAEDWLSQPTPIEIHEIVQKFFHKNEKTADIGCGSGRDTFWLQQAGFVSHGFDGSKALLKFAQARFPLCTFELALLPELKEIPDHSFKNVLCETVMQHLPIEEHANALKNLLRILLPGGILSMSFRHPHNAQNDREADGRMYTLVSINQLVELAQAEHCELLYKATIQSSSSGKKISQLVLKAPI